MFVFNFPHERIPSENLKSRSLGTADKWTFRSFNFHQVLFFCFFFCLLLFFCLSDFVFLKCDSIFFTILAYQLYLIFLVDTQVCNITFTVKTSPFYITLRCFIGKYITTILPFSLLWYHGCSFQLFINYNYQIRSYYYFENSIIC